MAKQVKNQSTPSIGPDPMQFAKAFNEPFADMVTQSAATVAENMENLQGELTQFAAKRLRQDADTFRECAQCQTVEEFHTVQRKWLEDASEAYMTEAGRMADLTQKFFSRTSENAVAAGEAARKCAEKLNDAGEK